MSAVINCSSVLALSPVLFVILFHDSEISLADDRDAFVSVITAPITSATTIIPVMMFANFFYHATC